MKIDSYNNKGRFGDYWINYQSMSIVLQKIKTIKQNKQRKLECQNKEQNSVSNEKMKLNVANFNKWLHLLREMDNQVINENNLKNNNNMYTHGNGGMDGIFRNLSPYLCYEIKIVVKSSCAARAPRRCRRW